MKKNTPALAILTIISACLCITSCSSESIQAGDGSCIWNTTGWYDENTYRIKQTAVTNPNLRDITLKKQFSREKAVLYAKDKLRNRFRYTSDIRFRKHGEEEYDPSYQSKIREIMRIIDSGLVAAERYDRDYTCEIIFEIRSPGLKKLCTNLYGEIPPDAME